MHWKANLKYSKTNHNTSLLNSTVILYEMHFIDQIYDVCLPKAKKLHRIPRTKSVTAPKSKPTD